MRNLKRFLAMTLTLLMVVSCFSFASFAQSFDDVYDYTKAVDTLTNLGIIWGYEDGTFGPDDAVQRWHMSLWIAKMETGKVSTDDYLSVWKAEGNDTDFTDVNVDQAIGAINYAAAEGIIIGTSATTFAPTSGITYQDALTMLVRALGYGSTAMDAGYPWKYINKAAELGLEDGITGIAYKDVLTRAETAQVLYNALSTVDTDGNTYISDVFGLTTVVITGTPAYKIINTTDTLIKTGYVSFNILNADGTINGDVTYHLPATAFGFEAADADTYVGTSFQVTTDDNFKTLGTVIVNPSEVFDAAKIVGQGTPAAPTGTTVTLGEDSFQAVEKYSSLNNAQGIKGDTTEILVYTTNATQAITDGYFTVDVNYNVLGIDGKIVAYYAPVITGSFVTPYVKKIIYGSFDAYNIFLNNSEIIAAGGVWNKTAKSEYAQTVNTYDLVKNNKYATATAYDDNADGVYDRLFYTYEEFANISADATTPLVANDYVVNGGTVVVNKFIDGKTGDALAVAPAGYIRYSYNQISKYLTVYETYTYGTGLVTTVNTATAKIVIGGTQYTVGIGTYPGAAYANTGVNIGLVGKQVNFILADGVVVRVFDSASAAISIVIDNLTGLTSTGYVTALVYAQSNQASVITIATINGYSYQNYSLLAQYGSLSNITSVLKTGMLFTGTKDALGFWHLTTANYTHTTPGTISFQNGIASSAITNFIQFKTNADTIYIAYNETLDRFYTAKGIPANGSTITVIGETFVAYTLDAVKTASIVYVNDGSFSTNFAGTSMNEYDTIIYVDNLSAATLVTNDLGNTTLLGYTYQYGRVLDMLNGKFITVYTTYNFQLQAGKFYTVSNGYVENIATATDIKQGLLVKYDAFSSTIINSDNTVDPETSSITYLYALDVNKNVVVDAAGAIINYVGNVANYNNILVTYYAGEQLHNRVMLITDITLLSSVSVKTAPTTTSYSAGLFFNPAGLVITLNHGTQTFDVAYNEVTKGNFTFIPSLTTALKVTDTKVTITYAGKTVDQIITVTPALAIPLTSIITNYTSGNSLITSTLLPAEATVTYTWLSSATADGTFTAITGATSATYTLVASDVSKFIKVQVTGTGLYGGTVSSNPTAAITPTSAIPLTSIVADAAGNPLITSTLLPAAATVTYRWLSCTTADGTFTAITGATSSTYTLTAADIASGATWIKVEATGTGAYSGTVTSPAV